MREILEGRQSFMRCLAKPQRAIRGIEIDEKNDSSLHFIKIKREYYYDIMNIYDCRMYCFD